MLILLCPSGQAQPISTDGADILRALCRDGAGGVYVAGQSATSETDLVAAVVARLDNTGAPLWTQVVDDPFYDQWDDIALTPDGGCIAAGASGTDRRGHFDLMVGRYAADGSPTWVTAYPLEAPWENACALAVEADGSAWVAGSIAAPYNAPYDFFLARISPDGDLMWSQTYGDENDTEVAFDLTLVDGGALMVGYVVDRAQYDRHVYTVRVDSQGGLLRDAILEAPLPADGHGVLALPDGGFAIAGMTHNDPESEQSDGLLLRIDANGNELWRRSYGGPNSDLFHAIAPSGDGGFLLAGTSYDPNGAGDQGWLVITAADGSYLGSGYFGGDGSEELNDVLLTGDERRVAVGYTSSDPAVLTDYYYLDTLVTDISNGDGIALPGTFTLRSWPNPFNSWLTVQVELPNAGPLRVTVHDILGREVVTLANAHMLRAGVHRFGFSAKGQASGTYFIQARGGAGLERVQRVVLVK